MGGYNRKQFSVIHNGQELWLCNKCGGMLPKKDFNKHSGRPAGIQSVCKRCKSGYYTEDYRAHRRDKYHRNVEERRDKLNEYRAACPEKHRADNQKDRSKNPEKKRARDILKAAVKSGKVRKPIFCDRCGHDGSIYRIEGHHDDYSKPLEVLWLCSKCHGERHRESNQVNSKTNQDHLVLQAT